MDCRLEQGNFVAQMSSKVWQEEEVYCLYHCNPVESSRAIGWV